MARANNKIHLVVPTWVAEVVLVHLQEIFLSNNMMGNSRITVEVANMISPEVTIPKWLINNKWDTVVHLISISLAVHLELV